jgi:hypothetical protein
MREVRGPDSLFVVEVDMSSEDSGEVIRTLMESFPESVALENVSDTRVTVYSRERALIGEVDELQREGKVTQYTVK